MKIVSSMLIFCALALTIFFAGGMHPSARASAQASDTLVYADFDKMNDKRPVSTRGGYIQLFAGQEDKTNPAKFKGIEGINAPELVHLKADDPNRAATFSYELKAPNQYANVSLEIQGLPSKDGKQVAEDVSAYKFLSLQVYAKGTPAPTGVPAMRIELVSHDNGIKLAFGFPQAPFKLSPSGFNTYKIELKKFAQPSWVQDRVSLKEVLQSLTAVQISVYCDQCVATTGTVVIDNVMFTN